MSDIERPPTTATDEEEVDVDEEAAGRPTSAAAEAGIVDQQAEVLHRLGEDARTVDE